MSPAKNLKTTGQAEAARAAAINTRWFKDRMADRQLTQRKVAKELDLDPAAVSLMLRGQRKIQIEEAPAMAELLGVPLADVLTAAGIDADAGAKGAVAVVGWVDDAGEVHMKRPEGPRKVAAPLGMPAAAVAVRYQTRGPTDGWMAFYVPMTEVAADAVGQVCVVKLASKEGGVFIRAVKKGYGKGLYNLVGVQLDQGSLDGVQLLWAAPVLWFKTGA